MSQPEIQMDQSGNTAASGSKSLRGYLRIIRPDHWFKNIFMVPGFFLALALSDISFGDILGWAIIGVASTCLIASANYSINEWLDAEFDAHHPVKKMRPSVTGGVTRNGVVVTYLLTALTGLALAAVISVPFLLTSLFLLFMGLIYNVPPMRTKDRAFIDVLSESVNNPLRLLLGWYIVAPPILPPASVLFSYWMGGAFLMAIKRFSEYRFINDPARAALYRKSFAGYTEEKLLLSAFFYALNSSVFVGVFLIKYKIEFLIALPLLCLLFVWYLRIGLRANSVSQRPEKLYKEWKFVGYTIFVGIVCIALFFAELPQLDVLTDIR